MVAVWEDRMQARFLSALFNRGAVCGQAIAGMICSQGRKANTPVRWLGDPVPLTPVQTFRPVARCDVDTVISSRYWVPKRYPLAAVHVCLGIRVLGSQA